MNLNNSELYTIKLALNMLRPSLIYLNNHYDIDTLKERSNIDRILYFIEEELEDRKNV